MKIFFSYSTGGSGGENGNGGGDGPGTDGGDGGRAGGTGGAGGAGGGGGDPGGVGLDGGDGVEAFGGVVTLSAVAVNSNDCSLRLATLSTVSSGGTLLKEAVLEQRVVFGQKAESAVCCICSISQAAGESCNDEVLILSL